MAARRSSLSAGGRHQAAAGPQPSTPERGVAGREESWRGRGQMREEWRAPPWKHQPDLASPHPRWLMETAAPRSRWLHTMAAVSRERAWRWSEILCGLSYW